MGVGLTVNYEPFANREGVLEGLSFSKQHVFHELHHAFDALMIHEPGRVDELIQAYQQYQSSFIDADGDPKLHYGNNPALTIQENADRERELNEARPMTITYFWWNMLFAEWLKSNTLDKVLWDRVVHNTERFSADTTATINDPSELESVSALCFLNRFEEVLDTWRRCPRAKAPNTPSAARSGRSMAYIIAKQRLHKTWTDAAVRKATDTFVRGLFRDTLAQYGHDWAYLSMWIILGGYWRPNDSMTARDVVFSAWRCLPKSEWPDYIAAIEPEIPRRLPVAGPNVKPKKKSSDLRTEYLDRQSELDAQITDRLCPACGKPCPTYRRTCKHCEFAIGRAG